MDRKTSYSVIIRTLTGGPEYGRLLKSLDAQTVRPEHIYIVQPHGFAPPKEQLGYEEYIHTDKGMWSQRIFGMEYCFAQPGHSEYLLASDDDIEFGSTFAEELLKTAEEYSCDTLVPIQNYKAGFLRNLYSGILGERTENRTSRYKVSMKRNGRFSVNNHLTANVNPIQTAPFACFLMRTDITPLLNLKNEMWLDETRYAVPDDQVFFYKSHLSGLRNYCCKTPVFTHLDGKAGVTEMQRVLDAKYSSTRNLIIFWRKFIIPQQTTFLSKIYTTACFRYFLLVNTIPLILKGIKKFDFNLYKIYRKGIKDGFSYPVKPFVKKI